MVILSKLACLLAVVSPEPQQPVPGAAAQPGTHAAVPFAAALPPDTSIAVAWTDMAHHAKALRSGKLAQQLAKVPWPSELLDALRRASAQLTEHTGLSRDTLLGGLSQGGTLALCGIDEQGHPRLALVLELGAEHSAAWQEAATRLEKHGTLVRQSGEPIRWTLAGTGDLRLSLTFDQHRLIAATNPRLLQNTLARLHNGGPSLRDNPSFREFSVDAMAGGRPALCAFAQPELVLKQLLPSLSGQAAPASRTLVKTLALHQLTYIGYTLHTTADVIEDHVRLAFPEPREGLLGALLGPDLAVGSDAALLIPPGVAAFGIAQLDIQHLYSEITALATTVEPGVKTSLARGLQQLKERAGVDFEQDILGSLGHRLVTLQWSEPAGAPAAAAMLQVDDSWRLDRAVSGLLSAMRIEPRSTTWKDHTVHALGDSSGLQLHYAFAADHLVVANSQDGLHRALDQLAAPAANPDATRIVAELPRGTRWVSWSDLGAATGMILGSIEKTATGSVPPGALNLLRSTLGGLDGSIEYTLAVDGDGASLRSRSPYGNLYAVAAVGVVAATVVPSLTAAGGLARTTRSTVPASDLKLLLARVRHAEQVVQQAGGRYLGLPQLLQGGHLPSESVVAAGGDVFRHGDYLVRVLLTDGDASSSHYAVMAWPAGHCTGRVLAGTADQPLLANDVIASSMGMRVVEATDLFQNGDFAAGLAIGWRSITAATLPSPEDQEHRLLNAILAAEQSGSADVPDEVFDALQSTNPDLVARAAYALGILGVTSAAPPLSELVTRHDDLEVRQHAMAALARLRSTTSITASIQALDDDDAMLRALAANNLGQLRAGQASDALIAAAARNDSADDGSQRDRIAALLALTDIGDAEVLLPVAVAVESDRGEIGDALTFLFQQLSPELDPAAEAVVLMAVLGHQNQVLRRYAVQRLGQLRDSDTLTALEGQLATEPEAALRPLIEVAIQAIRGPRSDGNTNLGIQHILATWRALSPNQRGSIAAGGIGSLALIGSLLFWRRRRRRADNAEHWAAMTAPSEEYEEELANAYTQYEDDPQATEAALDGEGDWHDTGEIDAVYDSEREDEDEDEAEDEAENEDEAEDEDEAEAEDEAEDEPEDHNQEFAETPVSDGLFAESWLSDGMLNEAKDANPFEDQTDQDDGQR